MSSINHVIFMSWAKTTYLGEQTKGDFLSAKQFSCQIIQRKTKEIAPSTPLLCDEVVRVYQKTKS